LLEINGLFHQPPQAHFGISVDGNFLPDAPENLLKSKNFAPVPYLSGVNSTEASRLLSEMLPPPFREGLDQETAVQFAGPIVSAYFPVSTYGKLSLSNKLVYDEIKTMKVYFFQYAIIMFSKWQVNVFFTRNTCSKTYL